MAILHVWKEIDLDDLLPLDDLPEVVAVGEDSDSVAVADEVFSDLGFFLRFLPSTAVGSSSMVVAAMAMMRMSGDDNFIMSASDILFACRD